MSHSDLFALIAPWLDRWGLAPDGAPVATRTSVLAPVLHAGLPAMLKIAAADEERQGADIMAWYGGEGAARVLAHHGDALLLERASGPLDLARIAHEDDDRATDIICAAVARLHAPRPQSPPAALVPLFDWYRSLRKAAQREKGIFAHALACAEALLVDQQEIVPLHGDIHHGNILDGGPRGWLAIDPKGLIGERAFDYCNLFCNPDAALALSPGRLERQIDRVAAIAGLDQRRLRDWVCAYAALSASWMLEDGDDPSAEIAIAERLA